MVAVVRSPVSHEHSVDQTFLGAHLTFAACQPEETETRGQNNSAEREQHLPPPSQPPPLAPTHPPQHLPIHPPTLGSDHSSSSCCLWPAKHRSHSLRASSASPEEGGDASRSKGAACGADGSCAASHQTEVPSLSEAVPCRWQEGEWRSAARMG